MAKVKEELSVKEQAKAFAELPKAERRAKYNSLPDNVQKEARKIIEAKRGVMHVNGILTFTTPELKRQIEHLKTKCANYEEAVPKLKAKIKEYESELAERNEE